MSVFKWLVGLLGFIVASSALAWTYGVSTTQTWTPSFAAVAPLGGTEFRALVAYNGQLWAGNAYWLAPTNPGAQILNLACPEPTCAWTQDYRVPSTLGVAAMGSVTVTYDSAGSLINTPVLLASKWYAGPTGVGGCNPGYMPVDVLDRNPADNTWYTDFLVCESGTAFINQVRAFTEYDDLVVGNTSYIFAGESPTGIFEGQYLHGAAAGASDITWNTTPEFILPAVGTGNPDCKTNDESALYRIAAFAAATGTDGTRRQYATWCWHTIVRIDGPSPGTHNCNGQQVDYNNSGCVNRWQEYWDNSFCPLATCPSQTGFRGLSELALEPPSGGKSGTNTTLIVGGEGPAVVYKIPPLGDSLQGNTCGSNGTTACVPCATIAAGVVTVSANPQNCIRKEIDLNAQSKINWGLPAAPTYSIQPYNNFQPWVDKNNVTHMLFGQSSYVAATNFSPSGKQPYNGQPGSFEYINLNGTTPANLTGDAHYWDRVPGGMPNYIPTYTQVQIPQLFSTPEASTRVISVSPFSSECNAQGVNCDRYFGGYDGQNAGPSGVANYSWCRSAPCPNPAPYNQVTNNTAWAVKLNSN